MYTYPFLRLFENGDFILLNDFMIDTQKECNFCETGYNRNRHKKSAISVKQATIGTVFVRKYANSHISYIWSGKFFYQDKSFVRLTS